MVSKRDSAFARRNAKWLWDAPFGGRRSPGFYGRSRFTAWPRRYARIFNEIGQLAREGARAVANGELESLGDLMNLNQGLLSALQLSSDRLDGMARKMRAHGALGAKLTGAGGDGGAVIGLFREPEPTIKRLRSEGVDCFTSQLAGPIAL